MDFALSEEQLELKEAARSWLADRFPLDRDWDGPQDDRWSELGELGWLDVADADLGFVEEALLLEEARGRETGELVREAIAQEWIELQALRYTNYRALGTYERTGVPGPEGSGVKLRWSEQNQRLTKLGRALLGPEGITDDGWWHHQQLRSRGNTIEAGTSEVLRNIIAERVLGLPRSR